MPGKAKKVASKRKRVAVKDLPTTRKKVGSREMKTVKGGIIVCKSQGGFVFCKNQGGVVGPCGLVGRIGPCAKTR